MLFIIEIMVVTIQAFGENKREGYKLKHMLNYLYSPPVLYKCNL